MNEQKCFEISVVIPCYNSELSLDELNTRLVKTLMSMGLSYEIIYVNDFSKDNTIKVLRPIVDTHDNIIAIDLMYNVGQFRALICGLQESSGKYVITMDDDLQHPPEEIEKLYRHLKCNESLDAVIGLYETKKHSLFRNIGTAFIAKLNEKVFNKPRHLTMGSFRCLNRQLVDAVLSHNTMFPVIGPLILKSTHRIENIIVLHEKRAYGKSNYSVAKLIKTSLDNIINFSSIPLKYISLIGVGASVFSFLIAFYYFIQYVLGFITLPGWTTIILMLNFYSGLLLLSVGIIGEYLIRILQEVNGYPKFIIRKIYGKD